MNKSQSALLLLVALVAGVAFLWRPALVHADTKAGEAKLQDLKGADTKGLKISLGDKVKAECNFFVIPDFFGKKVISVQAKLTNTTDKLMHYGYYVAFFDKDKMLVATSSFGGGIAKLEAGKEGFVGNVIELPLEHIERIAFYQVTVVDSDKEFGK